MMNYWNMGGFGGRGYYDNWMSGGVGIMLFFVIVWSLFWKGWALWKSARSGNKAWFVILLILNTLGILEIIYIFLVAKEEPKKSSKKK
jgi:hypothetical protein